MRSEITTFRGLLVAEAVGFRSLVALIAVVAEGGSGGTAKPRDAEK